MDNNIYVISAGGFRPVLRIFYLIFILMFPVFGFAQTLDVAAGTANPPDTNESDEGLGVEMLQFSLAASGGDVGISSIRVRADGTGHDRRDLVRRTGVKLVHDTDENGVYEAAADTVISSSRYSGNNGQCTFSDLTLSIPSGQTQFYLIVYDFDGDASDDETFRCRLDASGDITSDAGTINGSFPIYGGWKTVHTSGGTGSLRMSTGANNPSATTEPNNADGIAVLQLLLAASTREDLSISEVTFTGSGTGHDQNDISQIRLYVDANGDGAYQTGETELGSGTYSADNGTVTFSGLSRTVSAGSTERWLLVYDLNGTASNGETLIANLNANADITCTGDTTGGGVTAQGSAPYAGGTKTISTTGSLVLSAGQETPEDRNDSNNAADMEMVQVALTAGAVEDVDITGIRFTASGTADDRDGSSGGDIADSGVKLFRDANGNGMYDAAVDPQIGSSGDYSADNGTVTFSGLDETISAGETENWLLVYNLGGTASNNETFSVQLASGADVSAEGVSSSNPITPTGTPVSGCTVTMSSTGSLTLSVGANNPGASSEANDAHDVAMLQLACSASSAEDITVTALTFTGSGTGHERRDLERPGVFLYEDVNHDGLLDGGDVLVNSGQYNSNNGIVTITGTITVTADTTKNLLLVYDFDGDASNSETFIAQLAQNTDITATGVTTGNPITPTGAPVTGGTKTISTQGTLSLSAGAANPEAANVPNSSQDLEILQLSLAASSAEDMVVSSITFTASGTGHDVYDVSAAYLYEDTNGNGIYEPGTDSAIGTSQIFNVDNGTIEFSGFNRTVTAGTSQDWLVVYNMNSTASNAETFRTSIAANNNISAQGAVSGQGTVAGAPVQSNTMTITNVGRLTITAGSANPAATNEVNTASDLAMLQLNLAANDTENIQVTALTITASGTAHDMDDITSGSVKLYIDTNSDGALDGGDTQLGTGGSYDADNGTVTFSGFSRTISASSSEDWLVVCGLSGSASEGETFAASVKENTDVAATGLGSGQTVNRIGAPVNGGTKTITTTGSLTISAGPASPGPSNQTASATDVPVLQVALASSSVEDVNVTSITFTASGTGHERRDLERLGVFLYEDVNADGQVDGGDSLINSDRYNGDDGTVTLTGSVTVSAGSTTYLLLAYDFDGSASYGETFTARIAAAADVTATGVTSAQSITPSGTPLQSSAITISSVGSLTLAAGSQNATSPLGNTTEATNAADVEMLQFTVSANATEAVDINAITLNISGTGDDAADVTSASVELYVDNGTTAGTLDAGDTQLGSGQTWSADNGYVTFSGSSLRQVAAATSETWLLVMDFSGTAINGVTFKADLSSDSSVDAVGASSLQFVSVSGAPVTGGTKTIEATGTLNILTGDNNPGATSELSEATDVEMLQIKLETGPNEDVKITQITVEAVNQSGGDDTDVAGVALYLDVNANGVFDPGTDTGIASGGTFGADNGTVTFGSLSEVITAASFESWLVVYDFNSNALNTEQYQARVSPAGITAEGNATSNSITAGGSAADGGIKTITQEGTLTVSVGASTPPASNEASDADNVAVFQVNLSADDIEDVSVTQIVFTDSGSSSGNLSTELGAARLYNDTNHNGLLDGDPQIGGTGTLGSGTTITFSGLSEVITRNTSEDWLLVVDFSSSATSPDTFRFTVNASGDLSLSGTPNTPSGIFPVQGNTISISATPSLTISVGSNTPPAGNVGNDETDVELFQVNLAASSAADCTVTSIQFTAPSTTADESTDVISGSLELYSDEGSTPGVRDGGDILIAGSGSWSADNGTVTFSGFSRTIAASTSRNWLLVCDLSGGASGNETFRAGVNASTDVTLSTGNVNGTFPANGNVLTVSDVGTLTVAIGSNNPAPASIGNDSQDVEMLQIALTASSGENVEISAITFTATGTADDRSDTDGGDLEDSTSGSVFLYNDTNGNGVYDGDPLIGSGTYSADNGTVSFTGLSEVIPADSTENWLLVYDLDAASPSAGHNETFTGKLVSASNITAVGGTSEVPITPSGFFPFTGNAMTVLLSGSLTVSAGPSNPANGSVSNDATDLCMIQTTLSANENEDIDVAAITFTAAGTGDDQTDISGTSVDLYQDNGSVSGAWDAGDTLIQSGGSWSADNGTVTFSSLTEIITAGGSEDWILICDLNGNASANETFQVKVVNATDITASGAVSLETIVPAGTPVNGGVRTITPNRVLTVQAGSQNPAAGNVLNDAAGVAMVQLNISSGSAGAVDVDSITLNASGSGDDSTEITTPGGVKLYVDANSNGAYDAGTDTVQLGSSTEYSADNGTVTFSGTPLRTLSAGSAENWIVVYDLDGTASDGNSFRASFNSGSGNITVDSNPAGSIVDLNESTVNGGLKTVTSITSVTWQGDVSSDWNTSTNWSDNTVPGNTIEAIIADVSPLPMPSISSAATAKSLTVNAGADITVASGGTLTVPSSTLFGNGSELYINGGTVAVATGGILTFGSGSTFRMSSGTLTKSGSSRYGITLESGSTVNLGSGFLIEYTNASGLVIQSGTTFGASIEGSFDNGEPSGVMLDLSALDSGSGDGYATAGLIGEIDFNATISSASVNVKAGANTPDGTIQAGSDGDFGTLGDGSGADKATDPNDKLSWNINPTAVDIVFLAASGTGEAIKIEWETANEIRNAGFNLYRSNHYSGPYTKINDALIPGLGNSVKGRRYVYTDTDVSRGITVFYRLEDIDFNRTRTGHGPVETDWDGDGLPDSWEIGNGLDFLVSNVGQDADSDDLSDILEFTYGLNPNQPDTDQNGTPDTDEVGRLREGEGQVRDQTEGNGCVLRKYNRTDNHVYVELVTPFVELTEKTAQGTAYARLGLPGLVHGRTSRIGYPELPTKGIFVEIPEGMIPVVDVVETRTQSMETLPVYPVPELLVSRAGSTEYVREEFVLSDAAYRTNAVYPGHLVQKGVTAKAGTQNVFLLTLCPVQYNPVRQRINLLERLCVKVSWVPEKAEAGIMTKAGIKALSADSAAAGYLDNRKVYKITVNADGRYRMDATYFQSNSISLDDVDADRIQMFLGGVEVALSVETGGDGSISAIAFDGQGSDSKYTKENVYWLVLDGDSAGLRENAGAEPATERVTVRVGDDTEYWGSIPGLSDDSDHWLSGVYIQTYMPDGIPDINITLSEIDVQSQAPVLRVNAWSAFDMDHHVTITLNGTPVIDSTWSGMGEHLYEAEIDPALLVDGVNTVVITPLLEGDTTYEWFILDYAAIEYERTYQAPVPVEPAGIRAFEGADLRASGSGDYVVITPESFTTGIQPLTDYRAAQGHTVGVVTVESIYDEFGYGVRSPEAIREFLKYAYANWDPAPEYILLVGDTHRDCRDNLGTGKPVNVPTHLTWTPVFGESADDMYYTRISGDDSLPDAALGRLTVNTEAELEQVVNKIIAYETAGLEYGWERNLVFVSDNDSEKFEHDNWRIEQKLLTAFQPQEIFLSRFVNPADANTKLLENWSAGALFVNYIGHGALQYWAAEKVLENEDADTLSAPAGLPVVVSMNCVDGYFLNTDDSFVSLAEVIFRSPGGAVAVWSPAAQASSYGKTNLNEAFFEAVFKEDERILGKAILSARLEALAQGGDPEKAIAVHNLHGDPALRLKVPVPQRVESLSASDGVGKVTLSWDPVSGATGYNVYRGTVDGGPVSPVNTEWITETEYTDTSGQASVVYFYKVSAVNARGLEGLVSGSASAKADGPDVDSDGDGVANAVETALDTDPLDAESTPEIAGVDGTPVLEDVITDGTGTITYDFSGFSGYEHLDSVSFEFTEGTLSGEIVPLVVIDPDAELLSQDLEDPVTYQVLGGLIEFIEDERLADVVSGQTVDFPFPLPSGVTETDVQKFVVQYHNGTAWETAGTPLRLENNILVTRISHFSQWRILLNTSTNDGAGDDGTDGGTSGGTDTSEDDSGKNDNINDGVIPGGGGCFIGVLR